MTDHDEEPDLTLQVWADDSRRWGNMQISTDMHPRQVVSVLRQAADAIERGGNPSLN